MITPIDLGANLGLNESVKLIAEVLNGSAPKPGAFEEYDSKITAVEQSASDLSDRVTALENSTGSEEIFANIADKHIPYVDTSGTGKVALDSGMSVDGKNLIVEGSIKTGFGGISIGPNFKVTSGVGAVSYQLPDGTDALGVNSVYTEAGTADPFYYKLGARQDFPVNTTTGTTIPTPFTFSYTKQGDNLTYDLKFIPKSVGDLRLRYYLGTTADPEKLIFDEVRTVTQAEVTAGLPVTFGVGNKFLVPAGNSLFISMEGIDLDGGIIPSGPFTGQLFPYFVAVVHEYRKKPFFDFGWFNYDNGIASQIIPGGQWTTIQNNTLGPNTYTNFPPDLVTRMIDPATGRILLDELDVGDEVYIRHTINVIPSTNLTSYSFSQLFGGGPGQYRLPIGMPTTLNDGGAVPTGDFLFDTHFFILDENSRVNGMLPQILVSNETEIRYTGCYISVTRRA